MTKAQMVPPLLASITCERRTRRRALATSTYTSCAFVRSGSGISPPHGVLDQGAGCLCDEPPQLPLRPATAVGLKVWGRNRDGDELEVLVVGKDPESHLHGVNAGGVALGSLVLDSEVPVNRSCLR